MHTIDFALRACCCFTNVSGFSIIPPTIYKTSINVQATEKPIMMQNEDQNNDSATLCTMTIILHTIQFIVNRTGVLYGKHKT